MICCKITTDFDEGDFSKLWESLEKDGALLWSNGNLFYGSEDLTTSKQTVEKKLKKAGYTSYFIKVYERVIDAKEELCVNGWITDHVVKITIKTAERLQQKEFKKLAEDLDEFNEKLENELEEMKKLDETEKQEG